MGILPVAIQESILGFHTTGKEKLSLHSTASSCNELNQRRSLLGGIAGALDELQRIDVCYLRHTLALVRQVCDHRWHVRSFAFNRSAGPDADGSGLNA